MTSRISSSPIEREALRNSLKVLARRDRSAKQKIKTVQKILNEAREQEIQRLIDEKMADLAEVGNVKLNR